MGLPSKLDLNFSSNLLLTTILSITFFLQAFGVIPDIVTVGKPFGNGYPLAAVITTKEIGDSMGEFLSTVRPK